MPDCDPLKTRFQSLTFLLENMEFINMIVANSICTSFLHARVCCLSLL